jgi:hypothetical protein
MWGIVFSLWDGGDVANQTNPTFLLLLLSPLSLHQISFLPRCASVISTTCRAPWTTAAAAAT